MIDELVNRVFNTRNAAHLEHWAESSGYRHETLGAFYDEVVVAIDDLVEAHQGAFHKIKVELKTEKIGKIEDRLEEDMVFINANRKKITNGLPSIDNILQSLESVYLKTLYKLKNLK